MKVSVGDKTAKRVDYVTLNGKKVEMCIVADEEGGYIERYQTDDKGKVILSEQKDRILTEILYGQVEICLK